MTRKPHFDHVARPVPPWRDVVLTECGLPIEDTRVVISRQDFQDKVRRQGQQRAALSTCMTCWETAARWEDWTVSPSDVIRREWATWRGRESATRLNAELRAIAALIEAHRDEFDGYLAGLEQTADLEAARQARRRRLVSRRGRVL